MQVLYCYQCADKFLDRIGRKQVRKHVTDARDLNKIETRTVIKFLFLQGKVLKEIHEFLTETLACFLSGRARDLSAPLYMQKLINFFQTLIQVSTKRFCQTSGQSKQGILTTRYKKFRKTSSCSLTCEHINQWRHYTMTDIWVRSTISPA
jgi:hypothetical protein